jgi:hypothetical protein
MRSVARGKHVMRVAVTKNSARTGRGRLVSIMHPRSENPNLCKLRKNPGLELVILGNPSKRRKKNPVDTERVSGASVAAYRDFHGMDPSEVIRVQESSAERHEYVALGELVELRGRWTDGGTFNIRDGNAHMTPNGTWSHSTDIKLAQNPEGTQLYFIGGNQSAVMNYLVESGADTSKDFIEIGEATRIIYETRKQEDGGHVNHYDHKLGEHGGKTPILFFDRIKRKMFLVGGSYRIKPEGIVN